METNSRRAWLARIATCPVCRAHGGEQFYDACATARCGVPIAGEMVYAEWPVHPAHLARVEAAEAMPSATHLGVSVTSPRVLAARP